MFKGLTIRKRLFFQHLFIISLTVILLEVIFFISLYQYYYQSTEDLLKNHAKTSANFATNFMDLSPFTIQRNLSNILTEFTIEQAELQIVSPSGDVIASSTSYMSDDTIPQEQFADARPNHPSIYKGKNDADERIMSSMIPLQYEHETILYLRYNTSLAEVDRLYTQITILMIAIGLAIIIFVLIFSVLLANKITKPLIDLTKASEQLAKGRFSTRINEKYIGELNTLAHSFNDLGVALKEHDRLKDQFISSISHELRTPLTSIKGWGETMLLGDLEDKEETKVGLRIISTETDRLIALVEELLDFSQMNHQSKVLTKEKLNFTTIITDVVLQFSNEINKKQINVTTESHDELFVNCDHNKIKQIMINLVDNALKNSEPKSTIFIHATIEEQYLVCSIKDEGCGIPKDMLKNITKPFVKANSQSNGTGLGLAICKQIIEQHHGSLMIDSIEDVGTQITWKIPIE